MSPTRQTALVSLSVFVLANFTGGRGWTVALDSLDPPVSLPDGQEFTA